VPGDGHEASFTTRLLRKLVLESRNPQIMLALTVRRKALVLSSVTVASLSSSTLAQPKKKLGAIVRQIRGRLCVLVLFKMLAEAATEGF
jgi:hypothetical protein